MSVSCFRNVGCITEQVTCRVVVKHDDRPLPSLTKAYSATESKVRRAWRFSRSLEVSV